jgi:hypothetical protein
VGAKLAREGGGTFSIDASRPVAIASKLAPTMIYVDYWNSGMPPI